MTPAETVRDYYAALRNGEPLAPYFAARPDLVKFGVSERLDGREGVREGLREQTAATDDWTVESRRLQVTRRGPVAWFSDEVRLAWTDVETARRHDFETRWSGVLERPDGDGDGRRDWVVAQLHVSAPHDL